MKKFFLIFLFLFISLFPYGYIGTASETMKLTLFPISSELQVTDSHFHVKTLGKKNHEGFVFTIPAIDLKSTQVQLDLKGDVEIFLLVEETNQQGIFIKETKSSPTRLTNEWQTVQLGVNLSGNTEFIDVMLLTNTNEAASVYVKNILVNHKRIQTVLIK